jgi:hypothetical protein
VLRLTNLSYSFRAAMIGGYVAAVIGSSALLALIGPLGAVLGGWLGARS